MKRISFNDYEKGSEIPQLKIGPLQQMDLVKYAGASGDFNPIHTDPEFAKDVGLGGTIAHGMYIMALLGRVCSDWAHPLQFRSYSVKFKKMTRPGETIICTGKVAKKKEEAGLKLLYVDVNASSVEGEIKVAGELVIHCD